MRVSKTSIITSYITLAVIAILFILPFIWMVFASLDKEATLALKIPDVTLDNFKHVLTDSATMRSFLNGFWIAFGQAIIVVVLSLFAAYPLSRFNFKAKRSFMISLLFLTGLPIMALMVPVYQLFFYLKMTDSLVATTIFMASTGFPFAIWMMKNFMDSVPVDIEESAWIDGASKMRSLLTIVTPLMLPGIFTVFIMVFTGGWGNFFVPFILLNSPEKMPPAVTIYQFFTQYGMVTYGTLAAFSTLYTIPPIILYFIAQKYIAAGFSMGGSNK
ncbi:MAG: carbohydrate ABC transporter permease [Lentisphaerota bacterium]